MNTENTEIENVRNELSNRFSPIGELIGLDDFPSDSQRIGIGMECLDRELWEPLPALPLLKKLGIHHARLQSGWGRTERQKGVYDFAWLDQVVDGLLAAGVAPWLSLSYGNLLYMPQSPEHREIIKNALVRLFDSEEELEQKLPFLCGQGHNPTWSEEGMTGWLNYVAAIVSRYRGKVHCFEIWNEPDVKVFFPGKSWADEYMELVRRTVPVIRKCNPEAQIVGGSGGRDSNMEQMLERGIGEYVDIDSFHGYHEFPEKFGFNAYRAYRAVLDHYAPSLKLWRGEAGCPSKNPEGGHGALSHIHASEERQACWIARNIINDLAMRELDLTSYFHLYDFMHFSRKYRYHYGVLREDYSPKPSFYILQACAKLLDGKTVPADDLLLTPDSGSENVQVNTVVRSFRRSGAPFFAYWLADGNKDVLRTADFKFWAVGSPQLENPVAIDLLTRKIHALKRKNANILEDIPIMPYPLILAEYSTFADVISLKKGIVLNGKADDRTDGQYFQA